MDFSKIEEIRKKRELSQEQLAKKAGISLQGYYTIIRKHSTTIKNLEKLSIALDVPMSYWWDDSPSAVAEAGIQYGSNPIEEIKRLRKQVDDLVDDKTRIKALLDKQAEELKKG